MVNAKGRNKTTLEIDMIEDRERAVQRRLYQIAKERLTRFVIFGRVLKPTGEAIRTN